MYKILCCTIFFFSTLSLQAINSELHEINKVYESLSPSDQTLYKNTSQQLRCPTCTGLSVLESDASFSLQIRAKVLELIQENTSEKKIIEYFTDRYGLWILREPPKYGFHLLAWIIPFLLLGFGPLIVWSILRQKNTDHSSLSSSNENEKLLAAMEKDLKTFKNEKQSQE